MMLHRDNPNKAAVEVLAARHEESTPFKRKSVLPNAQVLHPSTRLSGLAGDEDNDGQKKEEEEDDEEKEERRRETRECAADRVLAQRVPWYTGGYLKFGEASPNPERFDKGCLPIMKYEVGHGGISLPSFAPAVFHAFSRDDTYRLLRLPPV